MLLHYLVKLLICSYMLQIWKKMKRKCTDFACTKYNLSSLVTYYWLNYYLIFWFCWIGLQGLPPNPFNSRTYILGYVERVGPFCGNFTNWPTQWPPKQGGPRVSHIVIPDLRTAEGWTANRQTETRFNALLTCCRLRSTFCGAMGPGRASLI